MPDTDEQVKQDTGAPETRAPRGEGEEREAAVERPPDTKPGGEARPERPEGRGGRAEGRDRGRDRGDGSGRGNQRAAEPRPAPPAAPAPEEPPRVEDRPAEGRRALDLSQPKEMNIQALNAMARELEGEGAAGLKKPDLIFRI